MTCVAFGLCLLHLPVTLAYSQEHSIDAIKKAWGARADQVKSLKFEWTESEFWPRNAVDPKDSIGLQNSGFDAPFPPVDSNLTSRHLLAISGEMIRYEFSGERTGEKGLIQAQETLTFDGERKVSLFSPNAIFGHPQGNIYPAKRILQLGQINLKPVAYAFRPFVPTIGNLDLDMFEIIAEDVAYDEGQRCILLRERDSVTRMRNPPGSGAELWLSPEMGYSILRYAWRDADGTYKTQLDVRYQRDSATQVWIPAGWRSLPLTFGKPLQVATAANVTAYALNEEMPRSYFQQAFPTGALIVDTTDETGASYIQRADGTLRKITRAEMRNGVPFETLVATEPGEELVRSLGPRSWLTYVVVGATLLVICLIGWYAFRRRQAARN